MAEPLIDADPELLPEAEITVETLGRLGATAILIVVLGIILSIDAIVRGLFGTISGSVGWIPFAGKIVEQPIHKIEQKVVSFLGGLVEHVEHAIANNIHKAGELVERFWHTLEETALATIILGALVTAGFFHYVLHPLERWIHIEIRKVEEEIERLTRRTIREGARVTHVVQHNIFPRIKGAEVKVQRLIEHDIRSIRATAKQAERIAVRTEKEVNALRRKVSAKAIAAAVAAAIGGAALEAIRCVNFGNLFKKWGCGLWSLLDDLLGLVTALFVLESVCEFLPYFEDAFGAVVGPIVNLLTAVPLGACEKVPASWAQLDVAAGPLPPAQTLGTFPD